MAGIVGEAQDPRELRVLLNTAIGRITGILGRTLSPDLIEMRAALVAQPRKVGELFEATVGA